MLPRGSYVPKVFPHDGYEQKSKNRPHKDQPLDISSSQYCHCLVSLRRVSLFVSVMLKHKLLFLNYGLWLSNVPIVCPLEEHLMS